MEFNAIHDGILFKFVDETNNVGFAEISKGGIVLASSHSSSDVRHASWARWGEVVHIGPDVIADIKVGEYILVEPLKWTTKITSEGKDPVWKTEEKFVIAVTDDINETHQL